MKHPIREHRDRVLIETCKGVIADLISVAKTDNDYVLMRGQLVLNELAAQLSVRPKTKKHIRLWAKLWTRLRYKAVQSTDPNIYFDPRLDPRWHLRLYWRLRPSKRPSNLVVNPSFERDTPGWGFASAPVAKMSQGVASSTKEIPSTRWHRVNFQASIMIEGENQPDQQELIAMFFDPAVKKMLGIKDVERDIPFYLDATFATAIPSPPYFSGKTEKGSTWSR